MEIQWANSLTDRQIENIRSLEYACSIRDGTKRRLALSGELNYHRKMPCFVLLYADDGLLGMLNVFAPASDYAEISAYVLPDYRRRGYFKALLSAARKILYRYRYESVLFVHEPQSNDGKAVLEHWQFQRCHTELLMAFHPENACTRPYPAELQIRPAAKEDLEDMIILNGLLFGDDPENARSMVAQTLESSNIRCYNAYINNKLAGVCNVGTASGAPSIFGLGIAPEFQERGYGCALLNYVLETTIKICAGEITLEVDSVNKAAFHLYESAGFTVRSQYDYYSADLGKIMSAEPPRL